MTRRFAALVVAFTIRASVANAQASPDTMSPRRQGQALAAALAREIAARPVEYFGVLDNAERYVDLIDQLPDSLADIKFAAHERLLGQYEYLDVDDGLRRHATAIIELARRMGSIARRANAFLSLARSAADRLHPDSALMILDAAEVELGSERTAAMFRDFRNRYGIIGAQAPAIIGDFWLNAGDQASPLQPGNGRVMLIEFTAHWCLPCQNSYVGIRALAERFRDQPFDAVFVTSLYGYLGTRKNLSPEREIDGVRDYFTREQAMPFKVAITSAPTPGRGRSKVDEAYRVGPIPQIVIVDKRGVIRHIVIGWDKANADRLARVIEELLEVGGRDEGRGTGDG